MDRLSALDSFGWFFCKARPNSRKKRKKLKWLCSALCCCAIDNCPDWKVFECVCVFVFTVQWFFFFFFFNSTSCSGAPVRSLVVSRHQVPDLIKGVKDKLWSKVWEEEEESEEEEKDGNRWRVLRFLWKCGKSRRCTEFGCFPLLLLFQLAELCIPHLHQALLASVSLVSFFFFFCCCLKSSAFCACCQCPSFFLSFSRWSQCQQKKLQERIEKLIVKQQQQQQGC